MQNNYTSDLHKSLLEKNAFLTAALLAKSDAYDINNRRLMWPGYDKMTFDFLLQFSPTLEKQISNRRDNPEKIVGYLHHIKNLCKRYRYKAILTLQLREACKFQTVIDDMIDPLLDVCTDVFHLALEVKPQLLSNEVIPEPLQDDSKEKITNNSGKSTTVILPQIVCKATDAQIEYYFMILTKEINPATGKTYMTEQGVRKFIARNFTACGQPGHQQYFEVGTEVKSTIAYFIYQFYVKYDNDGINNKMKYVRLLISNFAMFADDNPESLLSNMTPSKYPKNKNNVINTEKYFSRIK
ncbi:MAG: hypothetical protein V4580_11340 [Bacteroidota bacterium]